MNEHVTSKVTVSSDHRATVLMLLTNGYDPDPRVRQEALTLIGMGCRVRLLAWDRDAKKPGSECMEGVEVERVHLSSTHGRGTTQLFFYAMLYFKMLWRGLRTSFDVVHCHDLDTLPIGAILGKLKRKPIVYDAHESFPDMLEGSVHSSVRRALVWLENILIRRTNLLITVGEKLRRHFAARGARWSVVVGNWKRLDEYVRARSERNEIRRRLGIPDNALTIVYITHLLKDRKIPELLDALARCPDVYAIVGGKGAMESVITEAAGRNPRVKFVGFVPGRQIPGYTCAGDVVFYGFDVDNPNARFSAPNKLYEALAAGRPLVTGDFGEIADVVREQSCGIVLGDYSVEHIQSAFLSLRDDLPLRQAMADRAGEFGRTAMNWQTAEQTLFAEYSRIVPVALNRPGAQPTVPARAAGWA